MKKILKILSTIGVAIVMFIPASIFAVVRDLLHPVGFWQVAFVYGLGVYFMGGLQIGFIVMGGYVIYLIWQ